MPTCDYLISAEIPFHKAQGAEARLQNARKKSFNIQLNWLEENAKNVSLGES